LVRYQAADLLLYLLCRGLNPLFYLVFQVYLFTEALSDGGVRMGLHREMSTKIAAQTVMGAAKMVLETGKHMGTLKDEVCSAGGTTIAGVHALERGGVR
jgi:pyrroline-5-carboxylate reductase